MWWYQSLLSSLPGHSWASPSPTLPQGQSGQAGQERQIPVAFYFRNVVSADWTRRKCEGGVTEERGFNATRSRKEARPRTYMISKY
jgi:hypothetical protein